MAQGDTDINIEEAESWKRRVDDELSAVKNLVKEANAALCNDPTANDPILEGIRKIGQAFDELGGTLEGGFRTAVNAVDEAIKGFRSVLERATEYINEIGKKFVK